MLIRRIARPLLSIAFIGQGVDSLLNPKSAAQAAAPAVNGLRALPDPVGSSILSDPETFAQVNAAVQIGGGLLLATGKLPRLASAALAFTVLPANLGAHMFWNEIDPELKARKRQQFLTDLSLLGGLMIASADTAGKPSLGWRGRRAAERISERGRELANTAAERGKPLAKKARKRGEKLADTARVREAGVGRRGGRAR